MITSIIDLETAIRSARILIVDDVAANVEMLQETLEIAGYDNVVSTTDPRQALAMMEAQRFDLILLDMRMPEIDGHEFIRRAKLMSPDEPLPLLVLTAQTDDETRRRALAAGVRDFVTKPFLLWELLHRVHNALELQVQHDRTRLLNQELEARVHMRTREVEDTRREVIRRLASAGEFRDNDTGQHVVRMSHFAYRLALAAGLGEVEAASIRDAAPLHDIGKIGIPDAILLKPGKLDPDEWVIMQRHAAIGGEILADSGFPLLDLARLIAITHHEKWDGSGYPEGLVGDAIPLAGRIVAIADVFDALTSERPYKSGWPVEKAIALIQDGAGQHFDPALVTLFQRELPAILEIKDRFRDLDGTSQPKMVQAATIVPAVG
jgi:putative two-component system response regulator